MCCPGCKIEVDLPVSVLGRNVRCSKCGKVFMAALEAPVPTATEPVIPVLELAEPDRPVIQERPRAIPPTANNQVKIEALASKPRGSALPWVLGGLAVCGVFGFLCMGGVGIAALLYFQGSRSAPVARVNPPVVWEKPPPPNVDPIEPRLDPPLIVDPPIDIPKPPVDIPKPPVEVVKPPMNPEPDGPPVPPFAEPVNSFKAGTQTRLREVRTVPAPGNAVQLAFSPKHQLVFLRNSDSGVWVVDVKENKSLGMQMAHSKFTDMSLAPDESCLYVADYGGTNVGYGTAREPSHVHRYDLATRKWEKRAAPKIAFHIETVDASRFLLLEQDQWVAASLNRWEADDAKVTELARIGSDYYGDFDYDPRTGRVYHGNSGSSSHQISVYRVDHDKLVAVGNTGMYGTAQKGGGTATLSVDGSRFYYGALQVEALDVKRNIHTFPEPIVAASRDLAFGEKAYYNAETGARVDSLGFATKAYALSRDSQVLWAYNAKDNALHQYALEGEK
jgi:hypothetical protein